MLVAIAAVGVTAVTMPGCASCHDAGDFAQDTDSQAHGGVPCVICHAPAAAGSRVTFASRVLFGMVLPVTQARGRTLSSIADAQCLSCHEDVMIRVVESKGYRIDHAQCAQGSSCTDCHSRVAHGDSVSWARTPLMEDCLACHQTDDVRNACDTCHMPRTRHERLGVSPWAITHGPSWETVHGMGNLDSCAACHDAEYCVKCHGVRLPHDDDFLRVHSKQAMDAPDSCESCHFQEFCDRCHGVEMPHPVAFTREHSRIVEEGSDELCGRCHIDADCTGCHEAHVHPGGAIGSLQLQSNVDGR